MSRFGGLRKVLKRLYRALCRILDIATTVKAVAALILAYLPQIPKLFKFLSSKRESVNPLVSVLITAILSPYFPLVILAVILTLLLWRNWPAAHSPFAESFIEMVEERIRLGAQLARRKGNITFMDWKTWEEYTVHDMERYLRSGRLPQYIVMFRHEGEPTTYEVELGNEAHRRALRRQLRMLKDLVDRTDKGNIAREARESPSQSN